MSVMETILQSFTFAFDTTKVIQIYESTKLFRLKFVNKMNFFIYTKIGSPLGKSTFVAVSSLSIPKNFPKDVKLAIHSSTIFRYPLVGGTGGIVVE